MKKILILLIALVLVGCQKNQEPLTMMVPSGIPLIAVGSFLTDEQMEITDVNNPSLLVSAMTSQSHDIVIAPLNVGVKVHNSGNEVYQLAGILTFGNSYVVTRKTHSLTKISDLEGQKMLAYGQNSTPDIVLRTALKLNGVTTSVDYQANVNLALPFFLCNTNNPNDETCSEYPYLLAAEPNISMLEVKYDLELNVLDLQEVLKTRIDKIPQAGVFVRLDPSKKTQINRFLDTLTTKTTAINANPKQYAESIFNNHSFFESLTLPVLEKCIPRSQIKFEKVTAQTQYMLDYYELVMALDPLLLGNKLPKEGFYR